MAVATVKWQGGFAGALYPRVGRWDECVGMFVHSVPTLISYPSSPFTNEPQITDLFCPWRSLSVPSAPPADSAGSVALLSLNQHAQPAEQQQK